MILGGLVVLERPGDNMFIILYAKVIDDKKGLGVMMSDVLIGGFNDDFNEAENIARECVESIRGGMVIPRVMKVDGEIQDTIANSMKVFNRIAEQMYEVEGFINRGK